MNTITKSGRPLQDKELRKLKRVIGGSYSAHNSGYPILTQEILESVDVIEVDFQGVYGHMAGIGVEFGLALNLLESSEKPIRLQHLFQDDKTNNWHLGLEVLFARV